jgi:hypothetical protein
LAISAGVKWQIQQNGDDANNGGGFRGGSIKAASAAPGVATAGTGGTVAANTYKVVVTITDGNGETSLSAEASIVTTGTTSTITVTSPTDPVDTGATWNVYVGTAAGGPYFSQGTGLAFGANRVITSTPPTTGTQPPGVDRSQQAAAQVNIDNAAITATTTGANSNTLTFTAGYVPTANDVGNCVQITAGTNMTAGIYEITGWTSTTWTVTGAANLTGAGGAGSAVVGRMGGAHASLGKSMGFRVGSNDFYVKYSATPYAMSASNNVAGGNVSFTTGSVNIIGYDVTRTRDNTDANRPTFQASANAMTLFTTSGSTNCLFANCILDANGHTTVVGLSANSIVRNVKLIGLSTGITVAIAQVTDCYGTGCGTTFSLSNAGTCRGCVSSGHTVRGFDITAAGAVCIRCIADSTTTAGAIGFDVRASTGLMDQCIAYGHTGAGAFGFHWNSGANGNAWNCIAWGNATNFWVSGAGVAAAINLFACANGGATTTEFASLFSNELHGQITLTADPFVSAATGNYALNTTAGGGAALKAAGWPSSFPGLSTSNALDVGAAQSTGTSGGGMMGMSGLSA